MDALDELQQIEGVGVDPRITDLENTWMAVIARAEKEATNLDALRAEVLAKADASGLKTRQIANAIHMSYAYVINLLRYHRFLLSMESKITERRFRAYWEEHSDPHFRTRDKAKRDEYEESIFRYIAKQINEEIPPKKHPRTIKPVTNADIYKKADPIAAYIKEVERRCKEKFEPLIDDLIALSKADRSTFAPSIMGGLGSKLQWLKDNTLSLLAPPRN